SHDHRPPVEGDCLPTALVRVLRAASGSEASAEEAEAAGEQRKEPDRWSLGAATPRAVRPALARALVRGGRAPQGQRLAGRGQGHARGAETARTRASSVRTPARRRNARSRRRADLRARNVD